MSSESSEENESPGAEFDELRQRLIALESEQREQIARLNAALAAAQDRSYWLDRWNLDLNALMRRRGASELRAALRALRAVVRALRKLSNEIGHTPEHTRRKLSDVSGAIQEERSRARVEAPEP